MAQIVEAETGGRRSREIEGGAPGATAGGSECEPGLPSRGGCGYETLRTNLRGGMRRLESADREEWPRRERTDFKAFFAIVTREWNEDSIEGAGLFETGEIRDCLA